MIAVGITKPLILILFIDIVSYKFITDQRFNKNKKPIYTYYCVNGNVETHIIIETNIKITKNLIRTKVC